MLTVVSGGSFLRFFYNLKNYRFFYNLKNDERTVLLPVLEAELRDSISISIDQ